MSNIYFLFRYEQTTKKSHIYFSFISTKTEIITHISLSKTPIKLNYTSVPKLKKESN